MMIYVFCVCNLMEGECFVVFVIGGYGCFVFVLLFDIDLLFICVYKVSLYVESVIEYMLYVLWDMGLKVGYVFCML